MKIQPMSDLHREFGPLDVKVQDDVDVVVLAGDTSVSWDDYWQQGIAVDNPDVAVITIGGNHEAYGGDYDDTWLYLTGEYTQHPANYDFCENRTVDIWGKQFHACTLWTDMNRGDPIVMVDAMQMSDYRLITKAGHPLRPTDTLKMHETSMEYLRDSVQEGDVVVTHHAPSEQSIDKSRYGDVPINFCYYTELSEFILEKKPALWIHGHTHVSNDYMIGDTRVVCNPRGYVGHEVNPNFDPELVVEV
mgnify:CR=1 FL=1